MTRVSAVIPVHNTEAFIAEAVSSVLTQTHPDVEVIVVDNNSTDRTPQILADYGPRIRVHRETRPGVAFARNAGAALATGEWIAFLDADDVWLPHKVAAQLAHDGAAWSYTNRYNFGARGPLPEVQSDVTPMMGGDVFVPLMRQGNFITMSSVMMRRALFERLGGFFPVKGGCEDWDLLLRAAEAHDVAYVPEPLTRYRVHANSYSSNHRAMAPARAAVIERALARERGRLLPWWLRRQIWAETHRTNGWDAGRAGARLEALAGYARAAAAWPLGLQPYKEALKVCLHA